MTRDEVAERDQLFCELLFELGSVTKASEQLGITVRTGRKIANRNNDKILEMVEGELAGMAYQAVHTLRDSMSEDGAVAKAEVRLKASTEVLDRIGAAKRQTQKQQQEALTPVILLPAKTIQEEPVIKQSTEDDKL